MYQLLVLLYILVTNSSSFANDECSDFISKLPSDFNSGYISVPEDWNNISGNHIKIFYYGRSNPDNTLPTIAFFNGGPSASSHNSFELINKHPESKKLNFIYIDQRGTGCSSPFPLEQTEDAIMRLTHYSSRAIVKDAEAIRKSLLGEKSKWKIFGQSYGGLIVHRYLEVAPESIEAAHIHGYAIMSDQIEWMKMRILSQKRVTEDYFKEYPQDREDLEKIKNQIPANQCFTDEGISLCGPVILDTLRHPLGFRDSWEYMHWWIENLNIFLKDQPNMIQGFVNSYYSDFTHDSLASLVINKMEISNGPSDREECIEAFRRLKMAGENPELWPINECRILISIQNKKFDHVLESVTKLDPLSLDLVKKSLEMYPDLKLYLYSGQKDVFVPVDTFAEEAFKLNTLINYHIFPNSGHEGFNSEQLVWDNLLN